MHYNWGNITTFGIVPDPGEKRGYRTIHFGANSGILNYGLFGVFVQRISMNNGETLPLPRPNNLVHPRLSSGFWHNTANRQANQGAR